MTKRWMEKERDAQRRKEKETCACSWNFDDKFEVLCARHQAEAEECEDERADYEQI